MPNNGPSNSGNGIGGRFGSGRSVGCVGVVVGVCAGVVLMRVVGWLRSWVIDGMPPPLGRLVFSRFWPLVLLAVPLIVALPVLFDGWTTIAAFVLLLAADATAIRLLVKRPSPGAVPLAVSALIAAICLVDALAIAAAGGGIVIVAICALGYPLTRLFQKSIPGT